MTRASQVAPAADGRAKRSPPKKNGRLLHTVGRSIHRGAGDLPTTHPKRRHGQYTEGPRCTRSRETATHVNRGPAPGCGCVDSVQREIRIVRFAALRETYNLRGSATLGPDAWRADGTPAHASTRSTARTLSPRDHHPDWINAWGLEGDRLAASSRAARWHGDRNATPSASRRPTPSGPPEAHPSGILIGVPLRPTGADQKIKYRDHQASRLPRRCPPRSPGARMSGLSHSRAKFLVGAETPPAPWADRLRRAECRPSGRAPDTRPAPGGSSTLKAVLSSQAFVISNSARVRARDGA